MCPRGARQSELQSEALCEAESRVLRERFVRASRESVQGDVHWALQEGSRVLEASLARRVKPAVSGSILGRWCLVDRDSSVLKHSFSIIFFPPEKKTTHKLSVEARWPVYHSPSHQK